MKKLTGFWINFVWHNDHLDLENTPAGFRSGFTLMEPARRATLRISAFRSYCLLINDRIIGRGPERCTPRFQSYDVFDLIPWLRTGYNAIAIIQTMPTQSGTLHGRRAVWCDYEIETGTGKLRGCTDADHWRACRLPHYLSVRQPVSISTGWQEHVDARREDADWTVKPLEALSAGWRKPFILGPAEWTPPWRFMESRNTEMLQLRPIDASPVWRGRGSTEAFPPADNIPELFNRLELTASEPGNPRILNAGDVICFDLGRNRSILPELEVDTDSDALRLEFYGDIGFHDRPTASGGPDVTAFGGLGDSFVPRRGRSRFFGLNNRGCRFWTIRAAGSGHCRIRLKLSAEEYPYADDQVVFRSDDRELQAFWEIGRTTLRASTQDVFVDTCWREQSLWTRDAAMMGPAAFYSFGDLTLWKRSLRLIGESITPDGIPPAIALGQITHLMLFDHTMSWIDSLYDYFRHSNDRRLVSRLMPAVENFLRLCGEYITDDDLFVPPEYSWHFIDWGRFDRRPYALTVNAMLYSAVIHAEKLAAVAGTSTIGDTIASRLRRGLTRFYDPARGYFRSHVKAPRRYHTLAHGPDNNRPDPLPLHGNAVLLNAGFVRGRAAQRVADWMAAEILSVDEKKFGPSWLEIILRPLFAYGHGAVALELLRRRCRPAVTAGAPTFGEDFPFTCHNSAHGWSAQVNTILARHLWGIRILRPGFRNFTIRPDPELPGGEYHLKSAVSDLHLQKQSGMVWINR